MPAVGRTHFLLNPSKINGFSDFIVHFFSKWGKNGANYIFISLNLKMDSAITTSNIGEQSVNYANSSNYANSAGSANAVAWGNVQNKPHIVMGYKVANKFWSINSIGKFADSNNLLANSDGGNIYWGGNTWSDERLKKNIEASKVNCLDKVNKINLVEFDFIDEKKYGGHHNIGYIAQELKEIIPDAVLEVPTDEQDKEIYGTETLYTIDDAKMIPYLIKAIQELSHEIEKIKTT